ncbi:MAG: polysaccharide biosynthesis protein [Clostridia bacterium]|nr:polysaccharide biosynthesis protein [Clostridia bacterium]
MKGELEKPQRSIKNLFFSGVLVLAVANFLVKAVGLISKIALNRVVGSVGAGYYSSAYEIYAYLYVLSTAGLPVALSIMISKSRSKGRLLEAKKTLNIAIMLFLVIGFSFSLIMIVFSHQLASFIGAPETFLCIITIAPTMLFICLSSCMRGYLQGYQLMTPTAISQFIEAVCKVGIGVSLALWARSRGYADYVVASYTILGVTCGVFLGMVFLYIRKAFFKESLYLPPNTVASTEAKSTKSLLKEMLLIAVPITLSSSVLSLTTVLDTLMVQNRLLKFGMNEVGVRIFYGDYTSLVISMFTLPTILLYPIANAIVPIITTARERKNKEYEARLRTLSIKMIALISIPCAVGLSIFSKPILELLMFKTDSVERAHPWLSIASISVIFLGIISITNAFLNSAGKQRLPIISMLAGAITKLVSNYILLAKIGILGAPISTVLCYFVASGMNLFFVVKKVGDLPKIGRVFLAPFLCSFISIGACAILQRALAQIILPKIATVISIIVSILSYLIIVLRTKTLSKEEISVLPSSDKLIKSLIKFKILPKNSENI